MSDFESPILTMAIELTLPYDSVVLTWPPMSIN